MSASVLFRAFLAGALLTTNGEQKLAFAPAAGSSLTKVFESSAEFSLDSVSLVADGADMSAALGQIEFTMENSSKVEVTDLYKAVAEGRPLELLRTFDAIEGHVSMSMPQAPEIPEIETSSDLEGKTVSFRWNSETNEYERAFHESEGEASQLDGLEEDMDLRFLLPSSEMAVDGTWKVELESLMALASPGGNLGSTQEGGEVDAESKKMFEGLLESFGQDFSELVEGECVCTFKGLREEGGTEVGEIELALELSASVDLREILRQVIETGLSQNELQGMELDFDIKSADVGVQYEGTGTLLWDTKARRLHSFSLEGEVGFTMKLAASMDAMGESHSFSADMEMSGELVHAASATE